jgi:hypothetical protein
MTKLIWFMEISQLVRGSTTREFLSNALHVMSWDISRHNVAKLKCISTPSPKFGKGRVCWFLQSRCMGKRIQRWMER